MAEPGPLIPRRPRPAAALGDLARAVRLLAPSPEGLLEIARALGLEPAPAGGRRSDGGPRPGDGMPEGGARIKETPPPRPATVEPLAGDAPFEVHALFSSTAPASWPEEVNAAKPLFFPPVTPPPPPAPEPLVPVRLLRGFLQEAVGQVVSGEVDVDELLDLVARGRFRGTLPRRRSRGFRMGVELLVDDGTAMQPFRYDVAHISGVLRKIAGPALVREWSFEGSPRDGLTAPQGTLAPPWPPPAGTTVLALTDLGIARPRGLPRCPPDHWIALAKQLARSGCRLVALVPYGPRRWPASLLPWMEIVHWHDAKGSSGAADRERLRTFARLLSVAASLEPAMVRAARRHFFPEADGGLEGDFTFSTLVATANPAVITLRDDVLEGARTALAEDPQERERAQNFLAAYREHQPATPMLAFEEELVGGVVAQERGAVEENLQRVLRTMVERSDETDLTRWAAACMPTLPAWARDNGPGRDVSAASAARLGGGADGATVESPNGGAAWWLPPPVQLGLSWTGEKLVLRDPPSARDQAIAVPGTRPRVLFEGSPQARRVLAEVHPGHSVEVSLDHFPAQVSTRANETFELRAGWWPRGSLPLPETSIPESTYGDVYLKYSRRDEKFAGELARALTTRGLRVWNDREPRGEDYRELEEPGWAPVFAPIVSRSSVVSLESSVERGPAPSLAPDFTLTYTRVIPILLDVDWEDVRNNDSTRWLTDHAGLLWSEGMDVIATRLEAAVSDARVGGVSAIAWSPSSRQVAFACGPTVVVSDAWTHSQITTFSHRSGTPRTLVWAPDGSRVAVVMVQGGIYLHDLDGRVSRILDVTGFSVAWSSDGKLAYGGHDGVVRLTNEAAGQTHELRQTEPTIRTVQFSPDGRLLATAGDDTLCVWDATTGDLRTESYTHGDEVFDVRWLPGGAHLVSAPKDGTIRISQVTDGKVVGRLKGHREAVTAISVSPDGKLLLSTDASNVTFLWRLETGEHLATLPTGKHVAASLDWSWLATWTPGGPVDLWGLDTELLLRHAPEPAVRPLAHASAKIVLLGDLGVGKSGLARRLVWGSFESTESTHGGQRWTLKALATRRRDGVECTATLWDPAGQAEYGPLSVLSVGDADLALIVYDPSGEEPLRGVEYWLRRVARRGRGGRSAATLLVAARVDLDAREPPELEAFCRKHGVAAHVAVSASTGEGADELIEQMKALIPWESLPATFTTDEMKAIRAHMRELRRVTDRFLLSAVELRTQLDAALPNRHLTSDEIAAATTSLEKDGFLRTLPAEDASPWILIAPHLLDETAASVVRVARQDSAGAVAEHALLSGALQLPEVSGLPIATRNILVRAVVKLLLEHELCFREEETTASGSLLVFPELIPLAKPDEESDARLEDDLTYQVSGTIDNLYSSLVIQLSKTDRLTRTAFWRDEVRFQTNGMMMCGVRVRGVGAGGLELTLFYGHETSSSVRAWFRGVVETILQRPNVSVTVRPLPRGAEVT